MENIRYGNLHISDEKIIEAAKNAYAYNFIINFEKNMTKKLVSTV